MQCNIDAKGKAVRLVSGVVVTLVGVVLLVLGLLDVIEPNWIYAVAAVTIACGAFQIYEGWAGWCVVRAMGFRTPM
jgi:uncharacterized membrane protein